LNGTVGAIETGLKKSKENNLFVVWGDHVGISQKLLERMKLNFENKRDVSMIFPTVWKSNPYVNFKRVDKKIVEFQELKNLKVKLDYGENDCGCFLFDKDSLVKSIEKFHKMKTSRIEEHNFLEVFPYLEQQKSGIYTQEEIDIGLTLGINSLADLNNYNRVNKLNGKQK
jgi:bifunctional N-acetylglucosamine-1-phosphate-uridyltransferase/glucosamine-1-phosphate-acetyltransferase GlmU-like protein